MNVGKLGANKFLLDRPQLRQAVLHNADLEPSARRKKL
jgi:hypothetical protein